MSRPPLLASREPSLQIVIAVIVPAVFGMLCGILLSVSAGLYTVLSVLALLGGVGAGYEHADPAEGAGRGFAGGMLFGTFILFGHALAGGRAKASIPDPHLLLPVATTVIGVLAGAFGAALRARHERREHAPAAP